jgi:hypothetical protein
MTAATRELRAPLRIAAAVTCLAAVLAAVAHAAFAADARHVLAFTFPGIQPRIGEAASIFTNNARIMAAAFGFAAVIQAPWLGGIEGTQAKSRAHPATTLACDAIVAAIAAHSVAIAACGVGAYGRRMLAALLPHGPVELLAFSLALTLYLEARRRPIAVSRAVTLGAASLLTLAVAAAMETYL